MDEVPIPTAIRRLAEQDPDRPCVTCGSRTVTRAELDRRTSRLARSYEALGVGPDDLVTIALPNGIEFYEATVATWKLGATPQLVSAGLPDAERDAILEVASPALVVGVEDLLGHRTVPAGYEPDPALSDGPLPERTASSWKAPASGGSTGRPKVILSGTPGTTQAVVRVVFRVPDDGVQLVSGPLYHNAPFMFSSLGLFAGNHLVVMERFDAERWLRLVSEHRVDWAWVVPTMMRRIVAVPGYRDADMSSLRTVWHGAAPCPPSVKEAWLDWLGPSRVWELYGGTEAQGVTIISGDEWLEHPGSVGRAIVGVVSVRDAAGDELGPGEVGEIWMLPPDPANPTYRYVGAEPVTDGAWETIGDMGWVDADGYLYIADRRTDLILCGGSNVYPAEVEAALIAHPEVTDAAVIGLPDDDLGQVPHAVVQAEPDTDVGELAAFCADRLVRYKVPRTFELTTEPLRDDAGKVRRAALREARLGRLIRPSG